MSFVRILGTVSATLAVVCATAALALTWWILTVQATETGGFIELDGRPFLLIAVGAVCFLCAVLATAAGGIRTRIAWSAFALCVVLGVVVEQSF